MKKIICAVFTFVFSCLSILNKVNVSAAYEVTLVGIQSEGHDHTSYYSEINDYLNVMGYSDSEIQESTDITRSSFIDIMDEREIVVIRSHGYFVNDGSGNLAYTYMTLGTNGIFSSDFESLGSNLPNAKIFVFGGCYTAKGGPSDSTMKNLIVQFNNKGVRVAIGFQDSVMCVGANSWTKYFFWLLSGPSNVDEAATGAVHYAELNHWNLVNSGLNVNSMRYRGEWYMTF